MVNERRTGARLLRRRVSLWKFVGGVLSAALFASCSPKPSEIVLDTERTSAEFLLENVRERSTRLTSLAGRGIVSFDTPEMSGSASFEASMKKPDSLLVQLEGPLGIDVGTLFLSREKFVVYNSIENTVMTGNPENSRLRSLIPMNLSYEEMMNAFAGIVVAPNEGDIVQYRIDDDKFYLETKCGENVCRYWIDPNHLLVSRYEMRNASDAVVLSAKLSSFTTEENISAPKRINITMPLQHRQVTIAYNALRLNPEETDFTYKIPSSAKVVK
jgi:hypothetical protein